MPAGQFHGLHQLLRRHIAAFYYNKTAKKRFEYLARLQKVRRIVSLEPALRRPVAGPRPPRGETALFPPPLRAQGWCPASSGGKQRRRAGESAGLMSPPES